MKNHKDEILEAARVHLYAAKAKQVYSMLKYYSEYLTGYDINKISFYFATGMRLANGEIDTYFTLSADSEGVGTCGEEEGSERIMSVTLGMTPSMLMDSIAYDSNSGLITIYWKAESILHSVQLPITCLYALKVIKDDEELTLPLEVDSPYYKDAIGGFVKVDKLIDVVAKRAVAAKAAKMH